MGRGLGRQKQNVCLEKNKSSYNARHNLRASVCLVLIAILLSSYLTHNHAGESERQKGCFASGRFYLRPM